MDEAREGELAANADDLIARIRERAAQAERQRIVEFIRNKSDELRGKAWYNPDVELNHLATLIEEMK